MQWSETVFNQAIDPSVVRRELDAKALEMPRQAAGAWTAFPHPAPIILYQPGQGSVRYDDAKAKEYFGAVVEKMSEHVKEITGRWDRMKVFRQ